MYLHDALRQVSGVHTACTKVVIHLIPPLKAHTLVNLQPLLSCMLGATHCCNQVREEVCAAHCNQRGVSLQVSQAHHTVLCDLYPSRQQASQKCLSTDVIPAPALHRRTSEGQPGACTLLGSCERCQKHRLDTCTGVDLFMHALCGLEKSPVGWGCL